MSEIQNSENGEREGMTDRDLALMLITPGVPMTVPQLMAAYRHLTGRTLSEPSTRATLRGLVFRGYLKETTHGEFFAIQERQDEYLRALNAHKMEAAKTT